MAEQRTPALPPPPPSSYASRPPRAPSIASMRSAQRGKQPLPPSRRQSLETPDPYHPLVRPPLSYSRCQIGMLAQDELIHSRSGPSAEIMPRPSTQYQPQLTASPQIRSSGTRTPHRRSSSSSSGRERPGDRTPTAPSSPQTRRASIAPSQRSGAHANPAGRPLNTPIQGYGATHDQHAPPAALHNGRRAELGKGEAPSRSSTVDSVLSSPRRISTTYVPQSAQAARHSAHPAHGATQHRSPGSIPEYPVTQPNTGTAAHFRTEHQPQEGSNSGLGVGLQQREWTAQFDRPATSTANLHRRNQASLTVPNTPTAGAGSKMPVESFAHTLRRSASRIGLVVGGHLEYDPPARRLEDYDNEDGAEDDDVEQTNGTRVWYSSFASIDWVHDAVSCHELQVCTSTNAHRSKSPLEYAVYGIGQHGLPEALLPMPGTVSRAGSSSRSLASSPPLSPFLSFVWKERCSISRKASARQLGACQDNCVAPLAAGTDPIWLCGQSTARRAKTGWSGATFSRILPVNRMSLSMPRRRARRNF